MLKNRFFAQDNSLLEKQLFAEVDLELTRLAAEYKLTEKQDTHEFNMWFGESFAAIDHLLLQDKYKEIFKKYNPEFSNYWTRHLDRFQEVYAKKHKVLPAAYKKYKALADREIIDIGIAYAYTMGLTSKDYNERKGYLTTVGQDWYDDILKDYNALLLKYGLSKVEYNSLAFEELLNSIYKKYSDSLKDKNAKDVNFEKSVMYLANKLYTSIYESRIPTVIRNYVKDIKFVPSYGGTGTGSSTIAYVKQNKPGVIYLNLESFVKADESYIDRDLGQTIAHEIWHLFRFKSDFENKLSSSLNMLLKQLFNMGQSVVDNLEDILKTLDKYVSKPIKLGKEIYPIKSFSDLDSILDKIPIYRKELLNSKSSLDKSILNEDKKLRKMQTDLISIVEFIYTYLKRMDYSFDDIEKAFKRNIKPYMSFMQNLLYAIEDPNQKQILDILAAWNNYKSGYLGHTFYEMSVENVKKMTKKYNAYLELLKKFIANINVWVGRLDELLAESFGDMVAGNSNRSVDFVISFLNQLFMSKLKVNQKVTFNKFIDLGII